MARKLTKDDVITIRTSTVHGSVLARRFGIHRETILRIRKGVTWGNVEPKAGLPWDDRKGLRPKDASRRA